MEPSEDEKKNSDKSIIEESGIQRIGSLEGQNLIVADYDIDECNAGITKMFGGVDQ